MDLVTLNVGVVCGASLSTSLLAYGLASAPSRAAGRLGVRGLKRQRAKESPFALVEPFVRWLGVRLSGIVPDGIYARIDRALVLSGDYLGLTPDEYVACTILGVILGFVVGGVYAAFGGAQAAQAFLVVAGGLATYAQVGRVADRRSRDISRGLPYVIDLLALSMSAGLDFPGGIRQIVTRSSKRDDALNEELERILQELSLGHTRKEALEAFADRTQSTAVTEFVASVVQSEKRGNPLAETLTIQAQVSRQRRSMRAEEAASRSSLLIYLPIVLLMITVLLVIAGPLVLKVMQNF
jgi:tight adherence protein C